MEPYRIMLADDHALFRQGLKNILEKKADLKVVGEAGDGLELLNLLKAGTLAPDLIILDISMPNLRGIEVIPEIKMTYPKMKILIVTMHKDKEYLYQALAAGADGYFLKKDAGAELFDAVKQVRQGRIYVSSFLSELGDNWEHVCQGFRKPLLTTREREVLKLVAEGKSNQEIADLFFISIHTVERHRANIMNKLDINKIADLVRYAMQKGYI